MGDKWLEGSAVVVLAGYASFQEWLDVFAPHRFKDVQEGFLRDEGGALVGDVVANGGNVGCVVLDGVPAYLQDQVEQCFFTSLGSSTMATSALSKPMK